MTNYEFCVHFIERLLPDPRGARILDYGTGRATIVSLLREKGFDGFGCDVFYGGESWRDDVPPEYLANGIVRDMPDGRIPFDDETFSVVVSNQVFEHVPDLRAVLDEIHRVLKPGGILLFLFPDRSIWREGHYGIPFHHRFPRNSRTRLWYAALCRSLGFGYHTEGKPVWEWSREAGQWIDDWTYYRTYDELRATFAERFTAFDHHEDYWLATRFGQGRRYVTSAPRFLKMAVVRKWAGMVATCRKPGSPLPAG